MFRGYDQVDTPFGFPELTEILVVEKPLRGVWIMRAEFQIASGGVIKQHIPVGIKRDAGSHANITIQSDLILGPQVFLDLHRERTRRKGGIKHVVRNMRCKNKSLHPERESDARKQSDSALTQDPCRHKCTQ